jgi:hypothetical protein
MSNTKADEASRVSCMMPRVGSKPLRTRRNFSTVEPLNCGPVRRRHVHAIFIGHIGKETSQREEQF